MNAPLTLTQAQVSQMTGWDLLGAVGIYDQERRTWSNDDCPDHITKYAIRCAKRGRAAIRS